MEHSSHQVMVLGQKMRLIHLMDHFWDGTSNYNNEYWVGMEYDSARKVLCLSYVDNYSYRHKKFKIEGREMPSGVWTEIIRVEEHQPGERKNIVVPAV